jgi:hypothetical protein
LECAKRSKTERNKEKQRATTNNRNLQVSEDLKAKTTVFQATNRTQQTF